MNKMANLGVDGFKIEKWDKVKLKKDTYNSGGEYFQEGKIGIVKDPISKHYSHCYDVRIDFDGKTLITSVDSVEKVEIVDVVRELKIKLNHMECSKLEDIASIYFHFHNEEKENNSCKFAFSFSSMMASCRKPVALPVKVESKTVTIKLNNKKCKHLYEICNDYCNKYMQNKISRNKHENYQFAQKLSSLLYEEKF